jgi:hypothetical protein
MSALGQKQTSQHIRVTSALPPKADILRRLSDVALLPKADIAPNETRVWLIYEGWQLNDVGRDPSRLSSLVSTWAITTYLSKSSAVWLRSAISTSAQNIHGGS